MKILQLTLVLSIFLTQAFAPAGFAQQGAMSLNDCMAYAIEHNTGVSRQLLLNENHRQGILNAAASLLPSVAARTGVQNNYGRGIDPETNSYVNTETFYNHYSLEASMPLFAGLANINTYRASRLMRRIGLEELRVRQHEVALGTMQAFMDVVYFAASVDIVRKQLETSRRTLLQSQKMLEQGLKSAADVAQIEAQVATYDLSLTKQQNDLSLAKLRLKEQMNYPVESELAIDTFLLQPVADSLPSADSLVGFALVNNPKILQAGYSVDKARVEHRVALGRIFPSISVYAGYNTSYYKSSASGQSAPGFADQLRDNRGMYIGAQLGIPIFSGLDRKTGISRQRNNLRIARLENEEARRALQTEITQTLLQFEGYGKEYAQATKKVSATELAHLAALRKFEKGLVDPIELQTYANDLLLAKSQQLNARLQCYIKERLVRYYRGESLVENRQN